MSRTLSASNSGLFLSIGFQKMTSPDLDVSVQYFRINLYIDAISACLKYFIESSDNLRQLVIFLAKIIEFGQRSAFQRL